MNKSIFAAVLLFIMSALVEQGTASGPRYSDNLQQNPTLCDNILDKLRTVVSEDNQPSCQNTWLPSIERIKRDLVGHSLAEGLSNGYHTDDWVWKIEYGQIDDLEIIDVVEKNDKNYVFVAKMILSATYYSYNVKTKIKYIATPDSWNIDYVLSLGMHIIVTHEYDTCIKSSIVDDGWGGVNCVQFKNISEMTLVVGGDFLSYNGWKRFSRVVTPHSSAKVGGTFNGGSVEDYRINFIVRIN